MKLVVQIIFITVFAIACSEPDSPEIIESEGKLFLIGGGKRPDNMIRRMLKEAKIKPLDNIVLLPWSSVEPDSSSFYAKIQFQELGHELFIDL